MLDCPDAISRLRFEVPVATAASEHKGYIDVLVPSAGVIVEQKSLGIDLAKPEKRQGRMVTPAQQALAYAQGMNLSEQPRYIVACNFSEMWVYDREDDALCKHEPRFCLPHCELAKNLPAVQFLKGAGEAPATLAQAVSEDAGKIMAALHDLAAASFDDADTPENHHALSVLMTRLMFLMFCEDAGLVAPNAFRDYVDHYKAPDLRRGLKDLFVWLDTPPEARDPYAGEWFKPLPYMNGGLFRERTEIPPLSEKFRDTLLEDGCDKLDWSVVSPTVFGSIFEGALSHDARRANGQHFTSPQNIHKVIDPLFMDALQAEFEKACAASRVSGVRTKTLRKLHEKLGRICVLDPACGSGNFLTESYLSLRALENRILFELADEQMGMSFEEMGERDVLVSLANFHGIELEDFACCVARTALWIAEKQADADTAKVTRRVYEELPLKDYGGIVQANALRIDWNDVVDAAEVSYVIGNPPFLGAKIMNAEQKKDVLGVFGKIKLVSSLDYCSAWYAKAAQYMEANPDIEAALVSTSSICQGQQVAPIWGTLAQRHGIRINFAHRTFVWNSEASDQAHVHVVVVGFAKHDVCTKLIFDDGAPSPASQINGYLLDAPNVMITTAAKPICDDALRCDYGSLINDGGNYIFKPDELDDFLKAEPSAVKFVRPLVGSDELIKGKRRFVLYLKSATLADLKAMPRVMERVRNVRDVRAASSAAATRKTAERPLEFYFDSTTDKSFLVIPSVSSERRRYVPMDICDPIVVATNLVSIVPGASMYQFGVLESQFHNAWMRAVAGRLESRYRYAPKTVYNTFPWPEPDDAQRARIEGCAQAVLDARAAHPDATLADMYDPDNDFLFADLMAAHAALDAAVEAAYGVDFGGDEERIVAHLFKLYAQKTAT